MDKDDAYTEADFKDPVRAMKFLVAQLRLREDYPGPKTVILDFMDCLLLGQDIARLLAIIDFDRL